MEALFRAYNQPGVPGAAVMIIHRGKPVFVRAYGLANLADQTPVRPATNFRLASLTKQFTAMAIMMLVEHGKLTYERTLTEIFPEFPAYGRTVTLRHLLQHTSGLIDYEDLLPDTATVQVLDRDVLALMQAQDSTYFPPGTQYRYSNSGYAVLAMVVERVSGMRFAEFLRTNIFQPLGMHTTVAFENGVSHVPHRALGYREENGAFVLKDQSLTSAVLGDGGIYSSLEDLFKWDQALYTEKLVSAATLQQAFTPGVLADGRPLDYGFGWRVQDYRGHRRLQHTGSTSGFRNVIQRYPDDKFSVIILTNRAEPEVEELATQLTDIFLFGK
ncbi:MAG: beta-lactamase family protein [candidate division KSB1 bacterium]|nr:beta-lactamase family protein [candidate division KSB1 bacterium]MDZ7274956.1 beta-lactamase family protein [candidate division KSB1 bacterium]MDZ7286593.1 beta-lactamase family protein [candidate division KSB1 bacterium]MDZ7299243.1 beta-lactamase family protein [candidate division KSB1 bacterium]MDZ7308900.1 beta-lactamase family protein [candidate division KSB1 bacterium]